MASFVVLTPPDDPEAPERAEIIRDGFAWFALIIPVFWLLWHRLWFSAALIAAGFGRRRARHGYLSRLVGRLLQPPPSCFRFTWPWKATACALPGANDRTGRFDAIIEAPNGATAEAIYLAELGHTPKRRVPPPPSRGWTVQPDTKTSTRRQRTSSRSPGHKRKTLMRVAIIDYGSGNLRSATKAFERAARESGVDAQIDLTAQPEAVATA